MLHEMNVASKNLKKPNIHVTDSFSFLTHHTYFATYVFVINIYILFFILKLLYKWCIVHLYLYNLFLSVNTFQMFAIYICIDLVYALSLQLFHLTDISQTLYSFPCVISYSNTSSFHSFTGIFLDMCLQNNVLLDNLYISHSVLRLPTIFKFVNNDWHLRW